MRNVFALAAVLLLTPAVLLAPAAAADVDVLLVGNSYTSFNGLSAVLDGMLQGHPGVATSRVRDHSPGGVRLPQHLAEADGTNGDTELRGHLTEDTDGWHAVVFQDQLQVPGFYDLDPIFDASEQAFIELDRLAAAAPGAPASVLYMTWGRRDGDDTNSALYPDFTAMEARIEEGYRRYAAAADRAVHIAPVGPAFAAVHAAVTAAGEAPTDSGTCFYRLYNGDGSHPSVEGTWLVSATIARTLTDVQPEPLDDACGPVWAQAAVDAVEGKGSLGLSFGPADDDDAADDDAADDDDDDDDAADDDDDSAGTGFLDERAAGSCACSSGGAAGIWLLLPLLAWCRARSMRRSASP